MHRGTARGRAAGLLLAAWGVMMGACGDGPTAPAADRAGAAHVAAVAIAPGGEVVVPLGGSVALAAEVRGGDGAPAAGARAAWSTPDAAVTVDAAGRVLALALGRARVVASAGGRADTVSVAVVPAGGSADGTAVGTAAASCEAPRLVLAPGEARELAPNEAGGASVCLPAGRYGLVAYHAADDGRAAATVEVRGTGLTSAGGPRGAAHSLSAPPPAFARSAPGAVHDRVRALEQRALRGRALATRPAGPDPERGRRAEASPTGPASLGAAPPVGAVLTLNGALDAACEAPRWRAARVAAVGLRAVVAVDLDAPADGLTDADYREVAAQFDTLVYPVVTDAFGAPSDVDGNGGRVVLFFTPAVNALAAGGEGVVGGLFFARDLYGRAAAAGRPGCVGSNAGEVLYLPVADPSGAPAGAAGAPRSREAVRAAAAGAAAHELQHLVAAARRLYEAGAPSAYEAPWLAEGLSHAAEELVFYRAAGLAPRRGLSAVAVLGDARAADAFGRFQAANLARAVAYRAAESASPFGPEDDAATRGGAWQLLRFLADRYAAAHGGAEGGFWRALAGGSAATGVANLDAALGGAGRALALAGDWAVATFVNADARGLPVEGRYALPSWDVAAIAGALSPTRADPLRTWALEPAGAAPGETRAALRVRGGGAAYVRFGVPAGGAGVLRVAGAPAGARLTLVRAD